MVAIAPLGLLTGIAFPQVRYRHIFLVGIVLGIGLEGLQLLLASGIAQGFSILMRGTGLLAGSLVGQILVRYGLAPVARLVWRAAPFAALPYLAAVLAVNGWFSRPWINLTDGLARLVNVKIMPFYYHYFSSEAAAMASLLAMAVMYAPIGIFLWAYHLVKSRQAAPKFLLTAVFTGCFSLLIEFGKLMVPPKHPDFTNVLIGITGAILAWALVHWIQIVLTEKKSASAFDILPRNTVTRRAVTHPTIGIGGNVAGFTALFITLLGIAVYPSGQWVLFFILLLYALLLYFQPFLWLFFIPVLLPALDLSPLTGRLLLDEFDLFILVSIGVGYWRIYSLKPQPWPNRLFPIAVTLLWGTWVIATLRGIWPLFFMEGGLADSSHSRFEAWYVGKGLLWALLLIPLIRRIPVQMTEKIQRWILYGLITGLAIVAMVVLWERYVYVGLTNFGNVFRVTGTFSSMNTGGAYIEAFIAFAAPALAVWVLEQRHKYLLLIGLAGMALAGYAMLVTFSRAGYAGFIVGLGVVFLSKILLRTEIAKRKKFVLAGLAVAILAAVTPLFIGGFMQYRLSRSMEDIALRRAHWTKALNLMDSDILTKITGMGFGQYPITYLQKAEISSLPGTYRLMLDNENSFIRLNPGQSVFLDQIIVIEQPDGHTLSARVRQPFGPAVLDLPVCEKALLYSFNCEWHQLVPEEDGNVWQTIKVSLTTEKLKTGGWLGPSVKLSLYNSGLNPVDVDDISLITKEGKELLKNGDFSHGDNHWLFVTDHKQAWHIDQQMLEIYFSQGLLGLAAFVILLAASAKSIWPSGKIGNSLAIAIGAGLVAYLTVGFLGSTMDTARLSMLIYLGIFLGGLLSGNGNNSVS